MPFLLQVSVFDGVSRVSDGRSIIRNGDVWRSLGGDKVVTVPMLFFGV